MLNGSHSLEKKQMRIFYMNADIVYISFLEI